MKYGDKHMIHTDIYKPNPAKACERCCFGSGQHEPWCPVAKATYASGGYVPSDAIADLGDGCSRISQEQYAELMAAIGWTPDRRPGDPGYVAPKH